MTDISRAKAALAKRLREGEGTAPPSHRSGAFEGNVAGLPPAVADLLRKVMMSAHRVTDDDVDSARRSGASEDEIFELVVAAAVGQSTRDYDAALAALNEAVRDDASGDS